MSGAAGPVAALRDRVDGMEADWRRRYLPPPTRERPRPDPEAITGARRLEAAARELDAVAALLRALPPPEPGTAAAVAEADAAIRDHVGFLLELAGPADADTTMTPEQLEREVGYLRELAQRRMSPAG